jgi:hypothetical protein
MQEEQALGRAAGAAASSPTASPPLALQAEQVPGGTPSVAAASSPAPPSPPLDFTAANPGDDCWLTGGLNS